MKSSENCYISYAARAGLVQDFHKNNLTFFEETLIMVSKESAMQTITLRDCVLLLFFNRRSTLYQWDKQPRNSIIFGEIT